MLKNILLSALFLSAIGFMALSYAPAVAEDARRAQLDTASN